MAPEPPSISQINGAAILDDNMENLLFMITSSSSTIDDVGEGSQYLNPLRVTPPSPPWSPTRPPNCSMMTQSPNPVPKLNHH